MGGYVCQKCRRDWDLPVAEADWPEWAQAMKLDEQRERRRASQWRGRLVNYGNDAELDVLMASKDAGQEDADRVNRCVDCSVPISDTAQRCYSCARRAMHKAGIYDTEAVRAARFKMHQHGLSSDTRARLSEALKAAHARGAYEGVYQQVSRPERAIAEKLDALGVEYRQQFRFEEDTRRFDFCFPSANVLVEFDGTYWHSLDGAEERDAAKDAYAKAQGYQVVRIAEADYNELGVDAIVAALLDEVGCGATAADDD